MTNATLSGQSGQLIRLYEEEQGNITIEQLNELFPTLHPTAIKMTLMQGSELYRKKEKDSANPSFTEDDRETAKAVLRSFMQQVDQYPHLAYRSAKLVFDEVTGKRSKNSVVQNINVTVQTINQQIQEAERAEAIAKQKVIEVPEEYKELQSIDV